MTRLIRVKIFFVLGLMTMVSWLPADMVLADSGDQVDAALDVMKQWLSENESGEALHGSLRIEALEQQLQKGDNADAAVVRAILNLFSSDESIPQSAPFVTVRHALEQWLPTLSYPKRDELPNLLRAAKSDFRPVDPAQLGKTRQQLETNLTKLDRFLRAAGKNKAEGWNRYLTRDELRAELKSEKEPDFKVLERVQSRLERKHAGLQLPAFVRVRRSLRAYGETLVRSREQFQAQFEATLDGLADALEGYELEPTHDNASKVAMRLGMLHRSNQVPDLVKAIQHYYVRPNMYVQFSAALVNLGFEDTLEKTSPFAERSSGKRVSGQATTSGQTSSRLVPNADSGEVRIMFSGSVMAKSRTVSGPATVLGSGETKIDAYKQVFLNDGGFRTAAAITRCVTNNTIENILGSPSVVNQALPRARAALPRSETRTARRTEEQISERLDEQVNEGIEEVNRRYDQLYQRPLMRRDDSPARLYFRSDEHYLFARTAQAGDFQLAANDRPPELSRDHDLALRMHQSFLNNYVEAVFGGTTLVDTDAANLAEELIERIPKRLRITKESERWSIKFARRKPLTVTFNNNGYMVTVRGRQFTAAKRRIGAMHVTAKYQYEVTPDGPRRKRIGSLEVTPANFATRKKKILSTAETAGKAVLERRFEELFPAVIEPEGLQLPGRWEKAGKLVMQELSSQNGWLVTGWRMENSMAGESATGSPDNKSATWNTSSREKLTMRPSRTDLIIQ